MNGIFAETHENGPVLDDLIVRHDGDWPYLAAAMLFGVAPSDRALCGWQGWRPEGATG